MSDKPKKIKKTVAKAYVGLWRDGSLGWYVPDFISSDRYPCAVSSDTPGYAVGEWGYLCEVTIKPIKVNGKYKRRRIK